MRNAREIGNESQPAQRGGEPGATRQGLTCHGCETIWTGTTRCHCAACHRTFGALGMFDRHRIGGQCADPTDWGDDARLVTGIWVGPEWDAKAVFTK